MEILADFVAESLDFIQSYATDEGYSVGFSGGKDSIVTLDLVRRAGVKYTAHLALVPGNDRPEIISFVRRNYPEVQLICQPHKNFFDLMKVRGVPSPKRRWCCSEFKERRFADTSQLITGVRAEESLKRAKRPRVDALSNSRGNRKQTMYKPIFYWPEWAVWEYIERVGLKYPSLYDEGYSRVGCICCPFAFSGSIPSMRRLKKMMEHYPVHFRALRKSIYYNYLSHSDCFSVAQSAEDLYALFLVCWKREYFPNLIMLKGAPNCPDLQQLNIR